MKNTAFYRKKIFSLLTAVSMFAASSSFCAFAAGESVNSRTLMLPAAYIATATIAFLLLIGYCTLIKKRVHLFVLLYTSVFVVNIGYVFLSLSRTLPEALLANRISYLGAVFLPLFMLLIIIDECKTHCPKFVLLCLISISITVFFIAATPGYSTLYYKDVTLVFVNDGARLIKTYGPLHKVYYFYLVVYFIAMFFVIISSYLKKRQKSQKLAINLLILVFGNIVVWFLEQMFKFDFEFLSISYIITEMYLLSLYNMADEIQNTEVLNMPPDNTAVTVTDDYHSEEHRPVFDPDDIPDICDIIRLWPAAAQLTTRETEVFRLLVLNKKRKDIADELCVSENTIKKHTSNIFTKLNVSSRNEILKIISKIN